MDKWLPGDQICLRSVRRGRVGAALPVTIVADDPGLVATHLRPGTRCMRRAGVRGGPRNRNLIVDGGSHEEWIWKDNRRLILWRPDDAHSVQLFWRDSDGEFMGWYIDLHEPFRRTPVGFDTRDHVLDIWVGPDRAWSWKDEDEFAWAQEIGLITPEEASAIRAEGLRAIDRLSQNDEVSDRWRTWTPNPGWAIPRLLDGWEVPEPDHPAGVDPVA